MGDHLLTNNVQILKLRAEWAVMVSFIFQALHFSISVLPGQLPYSSASEKKRPRPGVPEHLGTYGKVDMLFQAKEQ